MSFLGCKGADTRVDGVGGNKSYFCRDVVKCGVLVHVHSHFISCWRPEIQIRPVQCDLGGAPHLAAAQVLRRCSVKQPIKCSVSGLNVPLNNFLSQYISYIHSCFLRSFL